MKALAAMLADADSFNDSFAGQSKDPNSGKLLNGRQRGKEILRKGNIIRMGDDEHLFDYKEGIFFLNEKTDKARVQTMNCHSCDDPFKKKGVKDPYALMHYCEFCNTSNCKACLTKTRKFGSSVQVTITKSDKVESPTKKGKTQARGKICDLCSRKFI
jgi:ribosomal protein L27